MESPNISQISGTHIQAYEELYKQVDPTASNYINAIDAANFLKKSGLSQATLGKIWDLSDPNCKGFLDKRSLFVALKLIALVQNGRQPSIGDLALNIPAPKMGDPIDWSISQSDRQKYSDLFLTLNPLDGKLTGNKMKPIMMDSKLPVNVLTTIWDLSDTDEDGSLDLHEFILALHLISKAKANVPMPSVLPSELLNIKRKNSQEMWSAFDSTTPMMMTNQLTSSSFNKTGLMTWIVSASDKAKYDELFVTVDKDFDGYVTGADIKNTLENGKLNSEQFALAMYFVAQKQMGLELPQNLSPDMIPPTLRPKPIGIDSINALDSKSQLNTNGKSEIPALQSTGNKELDDMAEELKELQIEKLRLESELHSDEASIKLKESEIKSLQNEIETLHQMLKQLDSQKSEARKRLDDLGNQKKLLEKNLHEINESIKEEKLKVENLSQQLNDQKTKVETQESELSAKRKELDELKSEEAKLESQLDSLKRESQMVSKNAGDTQLEISQIGTKIVELEEYERRVNDAINEYNSALSTQDLVKISSLLPRTLTPPLIEPEPRVHNGFNAFANESTITTGTASEFTTDPFAGEDPFKEDPFKSDNRVDDPFASNNFANFGTPEAPKVAFDPFGTGSFSGSNKPDPFGSDPFTSQSVNPGIRSESPTPELPPKKSKAPPPRPAPPKHASKTPLRAAPAPPGHTSTSDNTFKSDPFGSSQSSFDPFNDNSKDAFGSSNFANFANFDKCEIPPPVDPYATLASIAAESQKISNNSKSLKNVNSNFGWNFKDNI
ncbi:unnamed protein product [Oppiella nova]|uniref:Epidermal growth factor receptor substrate 15-like 1 n=1 Tax=Oppiella nova TaxID=334625 RepID=A0A7R9LG75_9ACAR|nr:unnamed protein product [Oppiella nova]CAG2162616.1 unnamed protein product [Oppiella nova]